MVFGIKKQPKAPANTELPAEVKATVPSAPPKPRYQALSASTEESLEDLSFIYAQDVKARQDIVQQVSRLIQTNGPDQVLPVLLKLDSLKLLHAVGQTLPNGRYGTVLVRHDSKEPSYAYVGGWRLTEGLKQTLHCHGRGAQSWQGEFYFGDFFNSRARGHGSLEFDGGNVNIGYRYGLPESAEGSFSGVMKDRRGDSWSVNWIFFAGIKTFAEPSVYHYSGGESVIGQSKKDGTVVLAQSLRTSPVKYKVLVNQITPLFESGDLNGLFQWREKKRDVLREAGDESQILSSLRSWRPNFVRISMIENLLSDASHAQASESPSNHEFLQIVHHFLGPAFPYTSKILDSTKFVVKLWGENVDQLSFVARTMPLVSGKSAVLELGLICFDKPQKFLFHQEKYEKPREMFAGAINQFLDGISLAWQADKKAGDASLTFSNQILKELLAHGPCADGRTQALVESLTKLGFISSALPEEIDFEKDGLIRASEKLLQNFRTKALTAYIAAYGGTAAESDKIEQEPRFLADFFSIDLFMQELAKVAGFSKASKQELDSVRQHMVDNIGVFEGVGTR